MCVIICIECWGRNSRLDETKGEIKMRRAYILNVSSRQVSLDAPTGCWSLKHDPPNNMTLPSNAAHLVEI